MKIKNIHKIYRHKTVLHDISLDIPEGKITSFIGPNGAGKSTVLNIIARLIPMDSGEVIIKGKNLKEWNNQELAKNLAILTQSNHITSKLTIRELVAFGRFPYSQGRLTAEDDVMIERALNFMELQDLQTRFIDELSSGQRQRALIAMTLAQDTDYILLDEPTTSLDIYHATHLMALVRRLCDEFGKTIIMVLHEINYASFYSDMICAFVDGHVAGFGTVEDMIKPEFLKSIYHVDFNIIPLKGKPLTIYF